MVRKLPLLLLFIFIMLIVNLPPIHLVLLYWNGGVLALVGDVINIKAADLSILLNALLVLISIVVFMKSSNWVGRLLAWIIFLFSLNGFVVFSYFEIAADGSSGNYPFFVIAVALIIAASVIVFDTAMRVRKMNRKE